MPGTILPDEGLVQQHQDLLGIGQPLRLPWKLLLWVNDITPTAATILGELVEPTFGGYNRVTLDPASYTGFSAGGGCSHCTWGLTPYTWYVTSPPLDTIYGWAAIDELAGVIRRVQRFDPADVVAVTNGGRYSLLPEFTLTSAECP